MVYVRRTRNVGQGGTSEGEARESSPPNPTGTAYMEGQGSQLSSAQMDGNLKVLERFLKLNPPTYNGDPDVSKAELWIEAIEKIFRIMGCSDQQRVSFAVFRLQGPAEYWWNMLSRKWEQEGREGTWAEFAAEFRKRFIPAIVQDQREAAFLSLEQGTQTIAQYEAKFSALARYNPHLVPTEAARVKRFIGGLRFEFRTKLIALRLTEYYDAVERGYEIENDIEKGRLRKEML